jgi:membrane dipeptidase
MNRRSFLLSTLAASLLPRRAFPQTAPIYLADMHFHSFFGGSKYTAQPLAQTLAVANSTLVAWSLVGDLLWFDPKTYKQKSEPKPGEAFGWFERELQRIKDHIADQKLKIVRRPVDVDLALRGTPHVVLAVEGAPFADADARRVKSAYDLGLRHLQLVHYTRSAFGDIQTEPNERAGLTESGKQVVRECNRLGILIDLAHLNEPAAKDALSLSRAPVVWSHGSVRRAPLDEGTTSIWRRRQLSLETAKEIAAKGGVVGLWSLTSDVGKTLEGYADRLMQLAEWLGEDHVAFGTDHNGLGQYGLLTAYGDLRRVIEHWQRQGVDDARIRKIASGNYARVLKAAMRPA